MRKADPDHNAGAGAYGYLFRGIGAPKSLLTPPPSWPSIEVERVVAEIDESAAPDAGTDGVCVRINASQATVWAGEYGEVHLERSPRSATYVTPAPLDDDELAHPYLGLSASYFAAWDGRLPFHAGAFVFEGKAWAVLGAEGAGKSTLLASLHSAGHSVLTDDLLIMSGARCSPGPRSLDLRPAAASALAGLVEPLVPARSGTRHRLLLPPIGVESVPLGGWIFLRSGPRLSVSRVPMEQRLRRLSAYRVIRSSADDPIELLELAARPAWDFWRPKRWEMLAQVTEALVRSLGR